MKSLQYFSLLAMLLHPMNSTMAFSTTATTRFPAKNVASRSPRQSSATQLNAFDLSSLDTFFQTDPYLAGFLTCSFKASAADMVAQFTADKDQDKDDETPFFNLPRNLAFILYGGLYQGCVQTFIFTCLFPLWFPEHTTQTVLSQVAIDLLVLGPMVCMPTVYTMKALLANDGKDDEEFKWTKGIETYVEHIQTKGVLTKYWSIWGPVQTLNFGVVPPHLRVVFVAMVSFFWICLLSTTMNSSKDESSAQVVEEPSRHPPPAFAFALPSFVPQQQQQQQQQLVPIPVLVDSFVERQLYEQQHAHSHP